jgi:hypothetical protein
MKSKPSIILLGLTMLSAQAVSADQNRFNYPSYPSYYQNQSNMNYPAPAVHQGYAHLAQVQIQLQQVTPSLDPIEKDELIKMLQKAHRYKPKGLLMGLQNRTHRSNEHRFTQYSICHYHHVNFPQEDSKIIPYCRGYFEDGQGKVLQVLRMAQNDFAKNSQYYEYGDHYDFTQEKIKQRQELRRKVFELKDFNFHKIPKGKFLSSASAELEGAVDAFIGSPVWPLGLPLAIPFYGAAKVMRTAADVKRKFFSPSAPVAQPYHANPRAMHGISGR